jgi:hypothetical protein
MLDTDDQEFEAAFRDASTGKLAAEETPQIEPAGGGQAAEPLQTTEAAPVPPIGQSDTDQTDIWANATPEQRAAYEAAQTQAQQLEHRLKSDDGRVSRFQRERDKMRQNLETLLTASQKDGDDLRTLVGTQEWKKSKTDYGDDLGPLFNVIEKLAEQSHGVSERLQQNDLATIEQIEQDNVERLTQAAPDYPALLKRADFVPWLSQQSKPWQQAFEINRERLVDPDAAAELIARYRVYVALSEQNGPTSQTQPDPKRAAQLDASRSASSRQPIVTDAAGDDDFEMAFNRAAAERERARAPAR